MLKHTDPRWTEQGKIPMRMTKEEVEKLKASADALKAVIAQIEH